MTLLQRARTPSKADGGCRFATGELPVMEPLRRSPDRLPCAQLLERINVTHSEGLDIDAA